MDYGIVRTLKWADADHTMLECMVTFPHHNAELPFTATATDNEDHGREIFERAVKGDFGIIDEYVAPDAPARDLDKEWADLRAKRNQLLKESDFSQFPDVQETLTDDEKDAWLAYRRMLRSIPNSFADPADILYFPEPPRKDDNITIVEVEYMEPVDITPTTEP